MVGAGVLEVMMKVMAPDVSPVGPKARMGMGAPMDNFVGDVHRNQSRRIRETERWSNHEGGQRTGERERSQRGNRLLPCRGEVVPNAVMPGVLFGEEVGHRASVVTEEAMKQVFEQRPAHHPQHDCSHDRFHAGTPILNRRITDRVSQSSTE